MSEPPVNPPESASVGGRGVEQKDAVNEVMTPAMRLMMLERQHRALDDKITELYAFPYRNQILLQRLKKQKLRLKDAIERLRDEMIPDLNA